jgi:tetratricopeptide (TPR) repeat protein
MPASGQPVQESPGAPSAGEAAARHVELGLRFYRAGEYGAARVEFEAAHGLSGDADLLHNLSWTAEKQGQIAAAIDYEERFLSVKGAELPTAELDQARGRLVRLRELQAREAGRRAAAVVAPTTTAAAVTATGAAPGARGWRPPAGALGLLVGGGAALVAGLSCGGAAIATGMQLRSGQAFTLREIEALNSRGEVLNGAAIALDVVGGVALTAGGAWTLAAWLRRGRGEQAPRLALWLPR